MGGGVLSHRGWLLAAGAAALAGIGGLALLWPAPPAAGGDPGLVMVEVVRLPVLSVQERTGEASFARHCAVCHGPDGAGQQGVAPPLIHPIYEPGHHGDGAFHAAVRFGVRAHHWRYGDMPAQPHVTEAETDAIIAYVRAVQRANGID